MDLTDKVIAFDADDTLWHNEINYRNAEREFARAMLPYCDSPEKTIRRLMEVEGRNLGLLGYGSKTFIIALVETALELSGGRLTARQTEEVIRIGKQMAAPPVQLFPDAERILQRLSVSHTLVLATKGDLKDQWDKIERSGLAPYFTHIEIMLEKDPARYRRLLQQLNLPPQRFVMVGNSFKSDIRPVVEIGASAIYIPAEITWVHEQVSEFGHPNILRLTRLRELEKFI